MKTHRSVKFLTLGSFCSEYLYCRQSSKARASRGISPPKKFTQARRLPLAASLAGHRDPLHSRSLATHRMQRCSETFKSCERKARTNL